ncbi:lasso peptide biosynthesis B2 protein [Streptomyces sp. NPDC058475]|uniref:lasso peptide biosynthesis B2 protein n=1 Tax=Streptomyces sp. NPDC058475 TaxID=3346518 RepID=UPI003652AAB7
MAALLAVATARLLILLSPRRIRQVLSLVRRGAAPATTEQALAARGTVVAISVRCAGEGCLQRSVATALLCRLGGAWPDWRTGIRTAPFRARAWVEAEGRPVGEPFGAGYHRTLMTVPSHPQQPDRPGLFGPAEWRRAAAWKETSPARNGRQSGPMPASVSGRSSADGSQERRQWKIPQLVSPFRQASTHSGRFWSRPCR